MCHGRGDGPFSQTEILDERNGRRRFVIPVDHDKLQYVPLGVGPRKAAIDIRRGPQFPGCQAAIEDLYHICHSARSPHNKVSRVFWDGIEIIWSG